MKRDPKLVLQDLIRDKWDKEETSYDGIPKIHTGWYDRNSGGPQVTITNKEEQTIGGGDTGITASDNQGGITQVRSGFVLINTWSGTRKDLEGEGFGNENINPKKIAEEMKNLVDDIIQDHPDGIIDGEAYFNSLAVSNIREVPETDEKFQLRYELQTTYVYVK